MGELLLSVNKISLLAFIITFGFIVYEFKLLNKDKRNASKPQIPKFNATNIKPDLFINTTTRITASSDKTNNSSVNKFMIILLILMLLFFAVFTIISIFKKNKSPIANNSINKNLIEIKTLVSQGIRVYNDKGEEIEQTQIDKYPVGAFIKIGVESIKEADIDKARIRINDMVWLPNYETKNYDIKHNLYYITYQIATMPAQLKIEAQLHSIKDGWLGD